MFLPGQDDIEDAGALLRAKAAALHRVAAQERLKTLADAGDATATIDVALPAELLELRAMPLYASLSAEAQLAAFDPPPAGVRKVWSARGGTLENSNTFAISTGHPSY